MSRGQMVRNWRLYKEDGTFVSIGDVSRKEALAAAKELASEVGEVVEVHDVVATVYCKTVEKQTFEVK